MMFQRMKNFLSRHPKKVAAVSVVAVGTLAWRYAKRRLDQWQEDQSRRLLDAARRRQHFEAIARTAESAMIALGPSVAQAVCEVLDTSHVVLKLQNLQNKKGEEWRSTWSQLKELVVSRSVALVYSQALLCVLLRVHLSVLAAKMFCDSNNQASDAMPPLDDSQLATCQVLINSGIPEICRVVSSAVSQSPVVSGVSLGQRLTLPNLEKMLWSVQTILCEDSNNDPLRNIPRLTEESAAELGDLLSSNEVWSLASSCVSRGLAHTVDTIASFYSEPVASSSDCDQGLPTSLTLPFAKVIPILDGICRRAAQEHRQQTESVDFLQLLAGDDKLRTLSANIYEAFGDTDLNHNPARGLL